MKSTRPLFLNWMFAGMLGLTLVLGGCYTNESDAADASIMLSSSGNGAQERPTPVTTDATGSVTGRYEPQTRQFTYTVSWNRLSSDPVAMHFHGPANPETVAPPVVPITGFPVSRSGNVTQTVTLTPEQEQQLLNNQWYFNVHSVNYPGGEVRGQVMMTR